jgi:heme-degrading monooxygenase HmoA
MPGVMLQRNSRTDQDVRRAFSDRRSRGMTSDASQPKFARIWRGRTTRDKADAYQHYLLQNGIAPLEAKGAVGVQMLREDRATETEFVTISYWESVEAMTSGRDADPRQAHHLERDPEFLIELPKAVQILTILDPRTGGTPP